MNDELLDTEEKQAQAVSLLTTLLADPGWVWYQKVLAANIAVIDRQIEAWMNDETNTDKDEIKNLKIQRYYQKQLMEHPAKLLEEIRTKAYSDIKVSPDPFYTAENIGETYSHNQVMKKS